MFLVLMTVKNYVISDSNQHPKESLKSWYNRVEQLYVQFVESSSDEEDIPEMIPWHKPRRLIKNRVEGFQHVEHNTPAQFDDSFSPVYSD